MTETDRLRPHPKDRLAAAVQRVDVVDAAARLRAEAHSSVSGHRQIALVRHGPVSLILFVFEEGGFLKEHQADGEVIIQVLAGRLSVTVAMEEFTLGAGALVALAPGQLHAVRALERSDMLLTVSRSP
jgi:quercetin dioxygenase-like cupin family protein